MYFEDVKKLNILRSGGDTELLDWVLNTSICILTRYGHWMIRSTWGQERFAGAGLEDWHDVAPNPRMAAWRSRER